MDPAGGPNLDGQAAGWNYGNAYPDDSSSTDEPWDVTAGYSPEELNGTFDMMGNVWEWMESPYSDSGYGASSSRGLRGGAFIYGSSTLLSSTRYNYGYPADEYDSVGFRVASVVPEPSTFLMSLIFGAISISVTRRRRRR